MIRNITTPAADAVRVGILGIRSAVAVTGQYGALVDYLSQTVGRPFTLIPLNQEDFALRRILLRTVGKLSG